MTNEIDNLEATLLDYRNASHRNTGEPEEGPLSDREREWLVANGWAAEYAQDDSKISEISGHLDSFRSGSRQQLPRNAEVELKPNWRSLAFTEIAAINAARDDAVIAFRTYVLDDRLIEFEDSKEWVETAAQQDGPATGLVTIPADAERIPQSPEELIELGIGAPPQTIPIKFPDAAREWVEVVPVRLGGVLDRLRGVANSLEKEYGWGEPYAVAFILTGESPPPLRGSVSVSYHSSTRPSTATITVNPDWVSPSDVARLYRDVMRKARYGQHRGEPGAGRPLQKKSAQLAVFAARHAGSGSWADLMTRWNTENVEWEYTDRRQFGRDCRKAYERVMRRSLEVRNAQSKG